MCGIVGIVTSGALEEQALRSMTMRLNHRGPDDHGTWIDQESGIGLGHRRLSIIDLSALGHQPMASSDDRYVISFNGEIYNHMALRAELASSRKGPEARGVSWRGHSDTESLLEAIAAWGLDATLRKCVGMFALALWDRQERRLQLARDRFGEKPLYFGWVGGDFIFASELKAIRAHARFDNAIDRRALRIFASRTYIPAPLSIYENIFKLEPGCILTMDNRIRGGRPSRTPACGYSEGGLAIERYWSYREAVSNGLQDPILDEDEALERLEQVLASAISGQAVADVPVGAFLSGGIDSSAVVALLQKYSTSSVRTFSIGFEEAGFNEAEYAKQVARHFGTEHNERYVTVKETRDVIPHLPSMYDEPFADSSQIPTYLVSKFAREHVKVALSGDGGDELFGGYNRYVGVGRLWSHLSKIHAPIRSGVGRAFGSVPPSTWNLLSAALPGGKRAPHFGSKVQKAFRNIGASYGLEGLFGSFLDEWSDTTSPVIGGDDVPSQCGFDLSVGSAAPDSIRMMYCDAVSYLPDDILCKVDRAAMSVSLETRVPFLDHRVAELAARIPIEMKIRGGTGKHVLRRLLYREAPQELFERPKAGFAVPIGEWIKGPLRPWAEDLMEPRRINEEGFFDAGIVQQRWQEHLQGKRDSTQALWAILMFQAWSAESTRAEAAQHSADRACHY